MQKGIRTALIVVTCAFGSAAIGQQPDFSKVEIKVSKVAGNVYMLEGAGGNIAASVGEDGIVIVDDQFAPLADKIRAALKGVTDKPLRFIINTHYHADHTGGNVAFHQDATIIAHDNARKRLVSGGTGGNRGSLTYTFEPSPKEALPVITFDHDVVLHLNGEEIRALHMPNGHTDGDSMVFFSKSNVVHMGDDLITSFFPIIDLVNGGSVNGLIAALENALDQLPPDVKIIPGHGPLATPADVRKVVTLLRDTRAVVEKGIKDGKTLEQLKQEKVLDPWKEYYGPPRNPDIFLETLYNDLTATKDAL